jgi:hypothetical protein
MASVLILGGYGTFGARIARQLVQRGVPVIIAGRDAGKAAALAASFPAGMAQPAAFDIANGLAHQLEVLRPAVVIHTCGPFQHRDYAVAEACIAQGVHYLDLADGRDFVRGIPSLNEAARQRGIAVISGASSVPGLSSAVIEHYRGEFSTIDSLVYGISPGQQTLRGLATTQAILSYVGKPLKPFAGHTRAFGWQGLYRQHYPQLGTRWMANCDIPDLDVLPQRYGIGSIRFSAGLELPVLHLALWAASWLVRAGLPVHLPQYAAKLLALSHWFDRFGSARSGMHMVLRGRDEQGRPHTRRWFLTAEAGDGLQVPCVPSVLLAERLVQQQPLPSGAYACVGLVSLADYMSAITPFRIRWQEN